LGEVDEYGGVSHPVMQVVGDLTSGDDYPIGSTLVEFYDEDHDTFPEPLCGFHVTVVDALAPRWEQPCFNASVLADPCTVHETT
jgi:hypothetical protein